MRNKVSILVLVSAYIRSTTSISMWCFLLMAQVIYTVGKDLQYQNTIVADTAPLVTAPVIVCTSTSEIFMTSAPSLFSFITSSLFSGQ